MLRGRHRGLPVAIARAVLLPHAYARFDRRSDEEDEKEVERGDTSADPAPDHSSSHGKTA